jgi:hypothetical protein
MRRERNLGKVKADLLYCHVLSCIDGLTAS